MRLKTSGKWVIVISALMLNMIVYAQQIVDLSTGKVNGSSPAVQIPINTDDDTYIVRNNGMDDPNAFGPVKVSSHYLIGNPTTDWVVPPSGARWISPKVDGNGNPSENVSNAIYYSTYRKSFYLDQSHCNIESVMLNFDNFAVDNLFKIRINGVEHYGYEEDPEPSDITSSDFSPSFNESFVSLYSGSAVIDPTLFVNGLNTIDIIVQNINTEYSYTGLLIDGDLTINYFHVWAPTIAGDDEFCSNETITLTGSPTTMFPQNYRWWIDECTASGSIIAGGFSNHDPLTTGVVGNYTIPFSLNCNKYYLIRLYVGNKCGQIKSVSKKIHVTCSPKVIAGSDFSICSGSYAMLNFTSTHWPVTITNNMSTTPNGTYYSSPVYLPTPNSNTYTITSPSVGTCGSTSDQVMVTVLNPNPNFTYSKSTSGGVCYINVSTPIVNLISRWNLYSCDAFGGSEVSIAPTALGQSASFNPPSTFGVYYKITHTAGTKSCLKTKSYFFPSWGRSIDNQIFDIELDDNELSEFIESIESEEIDVDIAPNPSTGIFQIDLSEVTVEQVIVYNSLGQIVYKNKDLENERYLEIDLTDLPESIYIVHLTTNDGLITKKVIKK
jgi:hypothetical protein